MDFVKSLGRLRGNNDTTQPPVGNAVLGVPAAEGGNTPPAGTSLRHRTRRNAGDGVPYAWSFDIGESNKVDKTKSPPKSAGSTCTFYMVAGSKSSGTVHSLSPKFGQDFLHGKCFSPLFMGGKLWYTVTKL